VITMGQRQLTVLTPYAVAPPRHGPQIRVAGVLGNLGHEWRVRHFSQAVQRSDLPWPRRRIAAGPNWVETRLRDPVSNAWLVGLAKLAHYPAVHADRLLGLAPRREIRASLAAADAVLVSPHYQFPWVRRHTPAHVPVVVDCHCIEADVWPARRSWLSKHLADEIRAGELNAWRAADCVFATCDPEADFIRSVGAPEVVVVPNATDVERIRPVADGEERRRERATLGLPQEELLAVFVGSSGYANVEAAEILEEQAGNLRSLGVQMIVAGRVGIGRQPLPGLTWVGEVEDVAPWLRAADIALCPLEQGSGTSLKVVEYLAAGLPLVSTAVGVRGLGIQDGQQALIVAADEFPTAVRRLIEDAGLRERLSQAAREHVVAGFSWSAAGARATETFDRLVREPRPTTAAAPAR
jgi:glycosyltransferase involved in cell wall biosynthesis